MSLLTVLQAKAWPGLTSHGLYFSPDATWGARTQSTDASVTGQGKERWELWMPMNERRCLSTVHRASRRTRCSEQTWALEFTGLGVCLDHHLTARSLWHVTFNYSRFQLTHLEYGDNHPCLIGSLWEFQTRGAERLVPNRYSLYIGIYVYIYDCVCVYTGTRHSVPLVLHIHKDYIFICLCIRIFWPKGSHIHGFIFWYMVPAQNTQIGNNGLLTCLNIYVSKLL